VPPGYRGVQAAPVRPGTYYVNPYAEIITPVDVQVHRVELTDITFPSRDGFILKPHIIVAYAVTPGKAPELLIRLADEGRLHQEDATEQQQRQNEVLQKIILPHVRGYVRIEGSNLDAKDFIVTDSADGGARPRAREQFQQALRAKVTPQCEELGLDIEAVTLGSIDLPPELAEQISARDVARATLDKNKTKVEQYKTEQELQAAKALAQQATEKVAAETRLSQAKTQATTKKENEKTRLETDLANAQLKLDAAREQAKAVVARGKAEADVINLNNEAEVAGLRKAVQGFAGVQNFAQFHIMARLAPALSEIFASDDSDFAKLFAAYMNQPGNGSARPSPARTAEPPPMPPAPADR
jgi:regulator of protease activity HflC (stomatin/prohibitin superfamily)